MRVYIGLGVYGCASHAMLQICVLKYACTCTVYILYVYNMYVRISIRSTDV